jgi:hypothetical protein
MTLNGRPFRIVVVGQEYGNAPARVGREARTLDIVVLTGQQKRFRSDGLHRARNQHMRGTTSVLRLLFGRGLGDDHAGEYIQLAGQLVHMFDAFALANFLLCSAIDSGQGETGSKQGRSTRTMQRNCARHFKAVMEILQPTVLVVQGRGVRSWLGSMFERVNKIGDHLERVVIADQEILVAGFTHPSAPTRATNWGNDECRPYLLDVVGPTIGAVHNEVLA